MMVNQIIFVVAVLSLCISSKGLQIFAQRNFPPMILGNTNSFTPLFPRFATTAQVAGLTEKVDKIEDALDDTEQKCPSKATGAKIIGDFCYSLSAPANYETAKLICFQNGGKLAEPNFDQQDFLDTIEAKFRDEVESAATGILIGAQSVEVDEDDRDQAFRYDRSGIVLPVRDFITQPEEGQVALIRVPTLGEGRWTIVPSSPEQNHSYLCQYNII